MTVDKPTSNATIDQSNRHVLTLANSHESGRHNFYGILQWLLNSCAIIAIGGGIGWLVGLSVSPVVANVVAVIITAAATLVATMGGWNTGESRSNKPTGSADIRGDDVSASLAKADNSKPTNDAQDKQENKLFVFSRFLHKTAPLPFALLMIGIFAGSIFGLQARNQSWFGSNLSYEVGKWVDQGLPKDEVTRRLFEREHPYTPYIQPWLWVTATVPISASVAPTHSQVIVSNPISTEVQLWTNLGLKRTEVVSRLFDLKYPVGVSDQSSPKFTAREETQPQPRYDTALYAVEIPENKRAELCSAWMVFLEADENNPARPELWQTVNDVMATTAIHEITGLISVDKEKKQVAGVMLQKICSTPFSNP